MSDPDIFDKDKTTPPVTVTDPVAPVTTPTTPSADVFIDQLSMIKNADGTPKYDSVPKALEALAQSQLHIKTLEAEAVTSSTELTSLRDQAAKNDMVEEVVARLAPSDVNQQVQATPQPHVVDEEAVLNLVRNALNADRSEVKKTQNVASVQQAIIAKYGEKASEVLAAKAQELGTSLEGLKSLSAENPAIVLALFGETGAPPNNPVSTSISMDTNTPAPVVLEQPTKSLLLGATSQERADFMSKIRDDVYNRHNVET